MMRIRKNDTVLVISGKDKSKKGTVLDIWAKKDKILIKDVALIFKHAKARRSEETSGIKKLESYVNMSNVMPVCSSCKKPCRINFKKLDSGEKVRICNRCKEVM